MGDYTEMSAYYDLIMTSGYYDYDAIVNHLADFDQAQSVLEIGSGTGLILERLVARRPLLCLARTGGRSRRLARAVWHG